MPEGFPTVEHTVASMTLFLERVREIPALTGDMRPRPVAHDETPSMVGPADYLDAAEMIQVPAGH